jgi:hypothetical protein
LKQVLRAQRFALHEPLRYRSVGAVRWRLGRIENISRSGVLFWSRQALEPDTRLEMSFTLPVGKRPPAIACRGRVVRAVAGPAGGGGSGLAVTIASYRFVRRSLPARA